MTNIPEGKLGLVAVSRDCFPIAPGESTFFRPQCDSEGVLRSYNQPKSLPYATETPWA